jgi:hypothetical protein
MLLRGVARTAVVAGTATAVSGRVARRQQARWAQQEQGGAQQGQQESYEQPVAAPSPADDRDRQFAQLKELGELKAQGVLTEEEFAAKKAQILGG